MRVLMTADVVGGVWNYALDLARALRAHDVEVTQVAHGGPLSPQARRAAQEVSTSVHARPWRLLWMQEPWKEVGASRRWLAELVERHAPDVLHSNDYGIATHPRHVPSLVVGHSCVLSWWQAVRGQEAPPQWARYRRHVRRALESADLVVTPTRTMRRALLRYYGPLADVRVVHNGCDPRGFQSEPKLPCVVTCGRLWDEAKDVSTLARAAPHLPWRVLVAGEDRHPDGGQAALGGLRSVGCLKRQGVAYLLARAALYVHPARYEPFGLAPLEAALSGCALVLSDLPSLRELWDGCATFFPPGDEQALVEAVRGLVDDAFERVRLSTAARARARRYSLANTASAYASLYRELAGGVAAPTPARELSS